MSSSKKSKKGEKSSSDKTKSSEHLPEGSEELVSKDKAERLDSQNSKKSKRDLVSN